jgi:hypothetical protein
MGSNNVRKENPWALYKKSLEAEKRREELRKRLKELKLEAERIELDMFESLVRDYSADKGFERALSRYTGNSPRAWEIACGPDGRIKDLIRILGWEKLSHLIRRVRRVKIGLD